MSKYIIAVFPSYKQTMETINRLLNKGLSSEFTILNNLPRLSTEDFPPKIDNFFGGVPDLFMGSPLFVNPMSFFGLPPQNYYTYDYKEESWRQLGIDRFKAIKYQEMMADGNSVTAIKAGENCNAILKFLEKEGGNPPVEIINA